MSILRSVRLLISAVLACSVSACGASKGTPPASAESSVEAAAAAAIAVSWTVAEGSAGGSVSASGLYTAAATPGTYHVVATCTADPTMLAEATVMVAAGGTGGFSIAPMPRITVPTSEVFGSSGGSGTVDRLVDEAYRRSTFGDPGAWTPASASWWAAVKIGLGPSAVLFSWADEDTGDGDFESNGNPYTSASFQAYTIQTCASSPDNGVSCSDSGGWTTAVTVTSNTVMSRMHLIPFSGKAWLKMVNTAGAGTIGEFELWDASSGLTQDTFFLHGDSITNICSKRGDDNNTPIVPNWLFQDVAAQLSGGGYSAWAPSTAYAVNAVVANVGRIYRATLAGTSGGGGVYDGGSGPHGTSTIVDGSVTWTYLADAQHWPEVIGAGNIGHSSGDALSEVTSWLPKFPNSNVWVNLMAANDLCYTTTATYKTNLQTWINSVKAAGHIPALMHPTWSQASAYCPQNIPGFIAVVDQLVASNGLPPAVPLYEATLNHPELLDSGDVHLNHAGCVVWQATIAKWAAANFYGAQ